MGGPVPTDRSRRMDIAVLNYVGQRVRRARLPLRPALLSTQDRTNGTAQNSQQARPAKGPTPYKTTSDGECAGRGCHFDRQRSLPGRRPSTVGQRSHCLALNLILTSAAQRPTSTSDCQEKAKAQVKVEHQPAPPKSTAALRPPPGSPTDRHRSPLLIFIFPLFTFYISSPTAPTKPPPQSPPPAHPATAGAGGKGKRPKAQRPPYACRPSPLSRERSFAPNFPPHTPLLIPA